MTTAWSHLPNAAHIDRVLADLKARPEVWETAQDNTRDAVWGAARGVTRRVTRDNAWGAARDAAWSVTRGSVHGAAWASVQSSTQSTFPHDEQGGARDALHALVAWDDVGYILDMSPDACRMLIHTAEGHHKHAAVLLLPAVTALTT